LIDSSSEHLTFNFGEDGDSLAIEHITGTAEELVRFFGMCRGASLELRTKSVYDAICVALEGRQPHHASLGCFRYRPELKRVIHDAFPRNELASQATSEYLPERFSYPFGSRLDFYRFMIDRLHSSWPSLPIYLSMESQEMCEAFAATPWVKTGSALWRVAGGREARVALEL
jgi:hypothetical protein